MKLAVLAVVTTLGLAGAAHAQPAPAGPPPAVVARPEVARPERARQRADLRQMLLERFDRNHDGRLEPQERRHAIRALRRLARRMAIEDRRELRGAARLRGVIRRYDTNHDGVVSPDEMPPGLARRLRPLDRNGDGWIDERDRP